MRILSSFNEIIGKTKKALFNFPVSVIWAILGTFYTIWFVEQKIDNDVEFNYIKIILVAILGISWLIATRLLLRYLKEEKSKNWYSFLMLIPLFFLGVYYFTLPNDEIAFDDLTILYRFALYLITGHLFVFFSPFLYFWDKNAYWNFLKDIFTAIVTSAVFSLVLYFGLTIALLSLKYLFKIELKDSIFFELFLFCLGIVNTWIFLAYIPNRIQEQTKIEYPKALLVFVKYILIPLSLLYLVILYAYSFKILFHWDLPKGWVSYLVIALSIIGFIIHVLINPIRKTSESRIIRNFYPWFYYALLPLLALLFVAIFKRIGDYGFTENRYLVLLLAFWILGMTLYILFSKKKKLRNLPMSVALLSLFVSFGFWGLFAVSKKSQAKQFKKIFATIKDKDYQITSKENQSFESTIQYLKKRNALDRVSDDLGYQPSVIFKDKSYWDIANELRDTLGIKITDYNKQPYDNGFHFFHAEQNDMLAIKGYDYLKRISLSRRDSYPNITKISLPNNKIATYSFELDSLSKTSIVIMKDKEIKYHVDLLSLVKELEKNPRDELKQEVFTLQKEFEDIKVKFLFQNMEVQDEKDEKSIPIEVVFINATVLLKEK